MELRRSEECGMEKGRLETLKSLVGAKLLSLEDAAGTAGMSEKNSRKLQTIDHSERVPLA